MLKQLKLILLLLIFISFSIFAAEYNSGAARTNAKLGLGYLKKGLYSASKDRLLTALKEDPTIASTWYCMGYYLEKTGNVAAAEKYYRKAIDVEPHSGEAKNNYGTYLCRQGRYSQAISEFLAAANEKNYLDAASAYENAGTCAMLIPNNVLALKYFHEALDSNPSMPFTLLSLAHLNYLQGNDADAEKYFSYFRALQLNNKPESVVQKYREYVFSGKRLQAQKSNLQLPPPSAHNKNFH